jgi:hypothetical protein
MVWPRSDAPLNCDDGFWGDSRQGGELVGICVVAMNDQLGSSVRILEGEEGKGLGDFPTEGMRSRSTRVGGREDLSGKSQPERTTVESTSRSDNAPQWCVLWGKGPECEKRVVSPRW